MTAATPLFRAIMLEFERRRIALGLPMEKFDEFAGLSDRYYAKALHADKPSGRQAQWGTVQVMADALFPHGFDLEIRPRPGQVITETNLKAKLLQLKATKDPKSQRELMRDLSMLAAAARKRIPPRKRSAIARRAGKAGAKKRWSRPQIIEITPVLAVKDADSTSR
jgi:hypothetical protein